jgi:hypothetical protein
MIPGIRDECRRCPMAAPGAYAVLVALSTLASAAAMPVDTAQTALHLPKLALQVPATVPATTPPHLRQERRADPEPDVDITGPTH